MIPVVNEEPSAVASVEGTNARLEEPKRDQYHSESEDDVASSSSSEPEVWIPDEPYGSRRRLLSALGLLKPGQVFFDDYMIIKSNFAGKAHLLLAKERFGLKQSLVLKFYWEETTLENAIEVHSQVSHCKHVCRIMQTLKTSKTGQPPCIAFEKGRQSLREWMVDGHSTFDKTWCLHQILTGLRELHAEGIVHGDVKPSNAMFFPTSVVWKLIDLDGAQKAGYSRAVCFTTPYAPPEVLRGLQEDEFPVAEPSFDIWSFGILAFEVWTGKRMFEDDSTCDEICEFVLDGKVEERFDFIVDESLREAVANSLKFDPTERWTADDALQHAAFQFDQNTTTTKT